MGGVDFGFLAVPADAPGVPDADLYAGLLDGCGFHRDLGYRTAWLIEHHFSDYYPCPAPVVSMAHIAAAFPDLALGTCVLVAPWHEPLRLAGELAMLTNMTEQKLYIGLGRGTAKYEYDAFGVDMTQARERFRETLGGARPGDDAASRSRTRASTCTSTRRCGSGPRRCASGSTSSAPSARPSSTAVMAELGLAPMCTSFGVQTVELLPAWEKRRGRGRHAARRRDAAAAAGQHGHRRHRRRGDRRGADLHDALHAGPDRPLRRVPRRHDERQGLRGVGRDLRAAGRC